MRLNRYTFFAVLGIALGFAVAIGCRHYDGCASHTDQIIDQYLKNIYYGQNVTEASNALRQIGSKAGTHLLELCKTEVYRPFFRRLPLIRKLFYEHPEKYQLAVEGYIILGPELKDTVPDLYQLIKRAEQAGKPNYYARTCFFSVGKDATRYLVNIIMNGKGEERDFAWRMLECMDQIYAEDLEKLKRKFKEFTVVQKMMLLNFMAHVGELNFSDKQFIQNIAEETSEDEDLKRLAKLTLEIIRILEINKQSGWHTNFATE